MSRTTGRVWAGTNFTLQQAELLVESSPYLRLLQVCVLLPLKNQRPGVGAGEAASVGVGSGLGTGGEVVLVVSSLLSF